MPKPTGNRGDRIPLLSRGDTRIGSAGFWNRLIRSRNAFQSLKVIRGATDGIFIADESATLSIAKFPPEMLTTFWHWAAPKEYNSATTYHVNEVILVSPGNAAIGGAGTAIAGLHVALQEVPGGAGHYPQWPLPNATISNASNFWMLLELYPTEMTYCLNGVDTQYFVNAQPKQV